MVLIKTIKDEIAQVNIERPHVVLLGAGASRAAFPNGDRNGRRLPLMLDFTDIVPVKDILLEADVPFESRNFEEVYSDLALDPGKKRFRHAVEQVVFEYFDSLQLPSSPTLYDYLILSLRPKDVIATFNWDPFLIQAAIRNGRIGGIPKLLFLHGNVLQGYCSQDRIHGKRGAPCSKCRRPLQPVPLLYPIREKDYESHPAIKSAWQTLKWALRNAFMVTIFGYSAPSSDRAAFELLKSAWGNWEDRCLEQIEIIDIRPPEDLLHSWQDFIHTHHYDIHRDFYDSWIANHPRRTGEAWWNQYLEAAFIDPNPIPRFKRLEELWQWLDPLLEAERRAENTRNRA